jgi:hypothetical protein
MATSYPSEIEETTRFAPRHNDQDPVSSRKETSRFPNSTDMRGIPTTQAGRPSSPTEPHLKAQTRSPTPRAVLRPPEECVAVPTISVVIPTHNRVRLLLESLKSVLSQTFPPNEVP